MTMQIQPATPDHAQRIYQIHDDAIRLLCAKDYTPQQIDSWLRYRSVDEYRNALIAGETNWIATLDGGVIAGYATYVDGELTALFVDPAHGGHGAGKRLLLTAEDEARRHKFPELTLQSTLTSRSFYERQGYVIRFPEDYPLPDGSSIPCYRMTKAL